jgi:predicted transcriptional regulator
MLSGLDEKKTAARLGISQSAVNQRKRSAGWNAVSALLDRYEELMDKLIQ